jgi:hypothetical protein
MDTMGYAWILNAVTPRNAINTPSRIIRIVNVLWLAFSAI